VRAKGIFSVQFPKNIQLEMNYTKYKQGQKAVNFNYLEDRKAILTIPIRSKSFNLYNRFTYDQIILPGTSYATAEWLISGSALGINANLTNYAMFTKSNDPYLYGNLAFSFRLPRGLALIPQAQYEYSNHQLVAVKTALEKYLLKNGFASLSYENNLKGNLQSVQFGFRYDFPFAQTGLTVRQSNGSTTMMELARGSLLTDQKNHYVGMTNRASVGKGGIVFAPFLDLNCNNRRDPGEPAADGLNIRINGGTALKHDKDTTVRVMDLEPYSSYLVELDATSFDNVAWKIKNKVIKIMVDPNAFKTVEIPVAVVGEVTGTITKKKGSMEEGLGRVIVNVYNMKSQLAGKTLSEQDGYFSYMGLAPGDYEVKVDTSQLRKLHLLAFPDKQKITIKKGKDGDIIEGIDFSLKSTLPEVVDSTKVVVQHTEIKPAPAPEPTAVPAKAQATSTPQAAPQNRSESIYLQVGAFRSHSNAQKLYASLSERLHYPMAVSQEDGWFKVKLGGFASQKEADLCKAALANSGLIAANLIKEIHQSAGNSNTANPLLASDKSTQTHDQVSKATTAATQMPAVPSAATSKEPNGAKAENGATENLLNRHYYVQVGAFINPKNAARLIKKISQEIPFPVSSVYRDQYYKVRFGPFATQKEMQECVRRIVEAGIMARNMLVIDYEQIGTTPEKDKPHMLTGFHVQVGAFYEKENAVRYFKELSAKYPYPMLMIEEDGFYKVRFGPFKAASDTKKCRKALVSDHVDCFMTSYTEKYF
ncbi:MAG: SPOR domain-containing protein, partial [Marinilabiliales bacterium]|nr:SPOR domain-containing protein [Marinilabiliales bacterium]